MFQSIVRYYQDGGFFMYPVTLALGFGIAVSIERVYFLAVKFNLDGGKFFAELRKLLEKGDLAAARKLCGDAPLARIMRAGIDAAHLGERGIQNAVDEETLAVLPSVEKRTHYLSMIANVSTLIGLLGTVTGLIQAFRAVALADPTQKGALLFKGISEAMNCTAFGLTVAIPFMVIYTYLQSKSTKIIDEIDEYSVRLINLLVTAPRRG